MPGPPLSRRRLLSSSVAAALGAAAGASALAGCDLDFSPSAASGPHAAADPDLAVVTRARAELVALISGLAAAPATSPHVAALLRVHRAQLSALDGQEPSPPPRARPLTGARLVARERQTVIRFEDHAVACHSGDLARVLASIAAGISMQPVLRAGAT